MHNLRSELVGQLSECFRLNLGIILCCSRINEVGVCILMFASIITRDRATFSPNLTSAVNYTVASPADAPASLTFGPSFFTLASRLKGEVTMGLNRQLDNQPASLAAAIQAKNTMGNLFVIELGNEPECEVERSRYGLENVLMKVGMKIVYASNSPIIPAGKSWNQDTDAASQKSWFTTFSSSVWHLRSKLICPIHH